MTLKFMVIWLVSNICILSILALASYLFTGTFEGIVIKQFPDLNLTNLTPKIQFLAFLFACLNCALGCIFGGLLRVFRQ